MFALCDSSLKVESRMLVGQNKQHEHIMLGLRKLKQACVVTFYRQSDYLIKKINIMCSATWCEGMVIIVL